MRQDEAKPQIIEEWRIWRQDKASRSGTQMLIFYWWLKQERSHLLRFRCAGDPWLRIKEWLQDYESTYRQHE